MHILIVDDDRYFRRSLLIELELEGYRVTEAQNATEAFHILEQNSKQEIAPDIVITDVRMPEMAGEEFVTRLKKGFPKMPVLVISAYNLPETLSEYPFLRKPFKIQQIIETMHGLVQNRFQ